MNIRNLILKTIGWGKIIAIFINQIQKKFEFHQCVAEKKIANLINEAWKKIENFISRSLIKIVNFINWLSKKKNWKFYHLVVEKIAKFVNGLVKKKFKFCRPVIRKKTMNFDNLSQRKFAGLANWLRIFLSIGITKLLKSI